MPETTGKKFQNFREWKNTRRKWVTILFVVFVISAAICLLCAYITNPFVPHPLKLKEPLKWKSAQTAFTLPKLLDEKQENTVSVFCNITGTDLVVGNPLDVNIELKIRTTSYLINSIYAKPHNAIETPTIITDYHTGAPKQSYIQMQYEPIYTGIYELWNGSSFAQFEATGTVKMDIVFQVFPTDELINDINFTEFETTHLEEIEFEPIVIDSGQVIQQRTSENLSLSLTCFVLFFASLEIALTFYDHSEDKEKKAEQEKKQYDNANPTAYFIY